MRWLSASCWCLSLHPDYVSFLRMVLVRDHAHLRQAALPHLQAFQAVGCPHPLGLEPRVFSGTHFVLSTLPLMRPPARTASMAGQVGVASSRQKQRTVALQIDSGADPQIIPAAGWEVLQTDSLLQEKVVAQPRSRQSAVLVPPPPGEHGWIRIPTATGGTPYRRSYQIKWRPPLSRKGAFRSRTASSARSKCNTPQHTHSTWTDDMARSQRRTKAHPTCGTGSVALDCRSLKKSRTRTSREGRWHLRLRVSSKR